MWANIQKEQQDIGTLLERFWVYCFCCVLFCLVGGFCCVFLYLVMDVLGIVISLLRRMFQLLLVIPFGRFCVIIRCLDWCLLDKWIERSRGLEKDLCCKGFDLLCMIGPSCLSLQVCQFAILSSEVFQTDIHTGKLEAQMNSYVVVQWEWWCCIVFKI